MSSGVNRIRKIFKNISNREVYVGSDSVGHLSLCTFRTCVQWSVSNPVWDSYIDNIKIIHWGTVE